MTTLKIDIRGMAASTHPDDRVILYAPEVRARIGGGLVSTAPLEVELVDGQATVTNVEPGPLMARFECLGIADTTEKRGIVPDSGEVSLDDVLELKFTWTPPIITAGVQQIIDEMNRAVGTVGTAVEGAMGGLVRSAESAARTSAQSSAGAEIFANSANIRAASAETKVDNMDNRVKDLETMGGLAPGQPIDGQTANLVEQSNTLTRQSLNVAIQSGMNAVSVRNFGAKGDGATDDTIAIQSAVDWVAARGGGEVIVPDGTYMIKAHVPGATSIYLVDQGGIELKNNIHLRMAGGATLRAIPNGERKYIIVRIYNKRNVTVSGGTIQGDRDFHDGATGGEWGYGIAISGGRNIHVEDVRCIDCWGDGINIQEVKRPIPVPEGYVADVAHNVTLSRVTCSRNRRQGMSVEGVVGLYVADSTFELTHGVVPGCGVDIEPWYEDQPTQDIVFARCKFLNNMSSGMLVMKPQTSGLTLTECVFHGNGGSEAQFITYTAGGGITVEKTTFSGTPAGSDAIRMQGGRMLHIRGNTVDARVYIRPDSDSNPADVWVSENEITLPTRALVGRSGVMIFRGKNIYVDRNTINVPSGSESRCIEIQGGTSVKITRNHLLNSSMAVRLGNASAPEGSHDITVSGNTIVDSSATAASLSGVSGFLFSENIIRGACHGNPGEACISYAGEVSGVRVLNNAFYQAPANATGAGRASRALRWGSFGLDTVASGNRLVPEGTNSFPLWLRSSTPLTSGYMGEESGLMACPTSRRPTLPQVGAQVLDTDLQKVVTRLDSGWVDAQGQPA